ncbi:MAG: amidohydrolase [Clostridia bacterium]|nr:amidohydrolase [Clostridia bacterium]
MRIIFENGTVYAGDGQFCQAFLVENGTILETGTNESVREKKADACIDLQGRFVCAGFNDSHMHLLGLGKTLSGADLSSYTDSLSGMIEFLREYASSHPVPENGWLQGRGWNQDYFTDTNRMPDRWDLDQVTKDVPLMITRTCGHCCVLNSKALEAANITALTEVPEGGAVGLSDGVPDGRLYDNAIDLASKCLPVPDVEAVMDMIRKASAVVNRYGIISVQTDDYCVFRNLPFETVNDAYLRLETAGEMTVHVYEQCNFSDIPSFKAFLHSGKRTGDGDDWFRIGPLKLLGDGALGSRTAHLTKPYKGTENATGFNLFTDTQMQEMVKTAHENGMQIAVHAIGDACLDQVLDAFESAMAAHPVSDPRHGIVHCQVTRADQLERIHRLNLHVYAQSVFLDYDNHIVGTVVPDDLAATSYRWKTLMKKGVCVSNGSDCPVELPDVMRGIQCAVTRTSMDGTGPYQPDEAFTVQEALDSFTSAGARASFEESVKGKMQPGMSADFVVLSADPFTTAPEHLHRIQVLNTWVNGRLVYENRNV